MLLASFRRRRSYVALLQLLPEYLPGNPTRQDVIDDFLRKVESGYVLRVLGGEYWMCRRERDLLYRGGKAGTSSRELAQAVRAPRQPAEDLDLVRRLSLLVRIHADIARYCYSDLFAASSEASALLEHLYHQVSSLRFMTKLDAWLRLAYEGELPREVREALLGLIEHFPGLPESSRNDPRVFLRDLRLHRLRSLSRVLEREHEVLLSAVFSDPLIGWIDWLRDDDIRRFQIASCLTSAKDEDAQKALVARLGREPAELEELERAIEEHCRGMDRDLLDLKADALRDKMDFHSCRKLRLEQIHHLLAGGEAAAGCGSFDELWSKYIHPFLEGGDERGLSKKMRLLTRYQCDVWLCVLGEGDTKGADCLRDRTRTLIGTAQRRFKSHAGERGRDLEAMQIRWLRRVADHEQLGLSPWSLRGAQAASSVADRCRRTVEYCEEALATLEWSSRSEYARYRSYFHSLRGRARYVEAAALKGGDEAALARRDLFAEAHRALDRAQAGTPPSVGANREALAIGLLRLAECLMVRADLAFDEAGEADLPKELINADRRLDRAWSVLDRAEDLLMGARQNMEWWACLYQLRAQIQVEHLLREIVSPREAQGPEPQGTGANPYLAPQMFLEGLNTVRQGLDVLLPVPRAGMKLQSHVRIDRFLRIWIELMICAATQASIVLKGATGFDSEISGLWNRWSSLNKTAGLERLVKDDILNEFSPLASRLPKEKGAEARRATLSLFSESASRDKLEKLWNELVASRGGSKALRLA